MMARPPVVFDLDGTLIDSLPDIAEAANTLLAEQGLPALPQKTVGTFVGMGAPIFVDRMIAATALDAADKPALMARFSALYEAVSEKTRLFPGVADALEALRAMDVPLGLCTNKAGVHTDVALRSCGLDAAFDVVIAGDTLPLRKPDPAPLLKAFDALGAKSGLYVGDSEVDAETAQRAKVPFALFTEGIRVSPIEALPHDVAFSDFADLSDIYCTLFA